jgi:hypothetical protein
LFQAAGAVVVGETMSRVIPVANELDAKTFEGSPTRIPVAELMQRNIEWLQQQIERGAKILDIGLDAARKAGSVFYKAEVRYLLESGFARRFDHVRIMNGIKVIVWKWVKPERVDQ